MSTLLQRSGERSESPDVAESTGARRRRGAVLILGAVVLLFAVKPIGPLAYNWVPVFSGLAFLLAAVVAGRRSPLWAPGLMVTAWGTAQVIASHSNDAGMGGMHSMKGGSTLHWSSALVYVLLGGAALLAAWLGTRGFGVSLFSIAAPLVFIGIGVFVHSNYYSKLTAGTCALLAAWGLWEILRRTRSDAPAEVAAA